MKGSIIPLSMYFMLVHITKCELNLERTCVMLEGGGGGGGGVKLEIGYFFVFFRKKGNGMW